MVWTIELADSATKQLKKLDRQVSARVLKFLYERVALLEDPRDIGEAMQGKDWGNFWKYRVGDWRIIADIDDGVVTITVVRIGNRREVYRR